MRARSILLLASASLFFSAAASAAQNNEDDNKSSASAALKWQTRTPITGPTSGIIGNSTLGVEFSADLDPVADPQKPLLAVDMPKGATVQASWSDGKSIQVKVVDGGGSDATFKVQHTLAPHVKVHLNVLSFNLTYDYTATSLLQAIPGSSWNYEGLGQAQFAPWGWTPANLKVTAPALNQAQIFSIPFPQLGNQPLLGGNLALANAQLELALAAPNLTTVQRQRFRARLLEVRGWMREQQQERPRGGDSQLTFNSAPAN